MPTALDVKKEFYNANASKAYPLDQSTGGVPGTLPCGLLVDAYLLVDGEDAEEYEAYISSIEVSSTGFTLSLSVSTGNRTYSFERVLYCAFINPRNTEISFIAADGDISVAGAFTIGDPTLIRDWPPETELTEAQTLLSPLVIKNVNGLFITSLIVGDTVVTGGPVELVAGDGIELSVTGSTITISNTRYSLNGGTVSTSAELVSEAVAIYGEPVRSINGVAPDDNGNISIVVPVTETSDRYYIQPSNEASGTGSITIAINRDPCVENDTVDALMQNISELNTRASRLDDGIKALDNGINAITIQLTRL